MRRSLRGVRRAVIRKAPDPDQRKPRNRYGAAVRREADLLETLLALVVVAGGVATLFFAFLSLADGYDWHALAFASGGLYLTLWSAVRLTSVG
jgi:hypothetical protein